MKANMLRKWETANTNYYFEKALEIYNNLEDYQVDYAIENLRYVFSNTVDEEAKSFYLNNVQNLDRIILIESQKFLDNINVEVFKDILNEIDERLFLTCNKIHILLDKDNKEELSALDVNLEYDDSGVYLASSNTVVLNAYSLMVCSYFLCNSYESFKSLSSFMFLHAFIETLANYTIHEEILPNEFIAGGTDSEILHLYSFKVTRNMLRNFNLNIFKEDFLSNLWNEFKENPPEPLDDDSEESSKEPFSLNKKGFELNLSDEDMSILDALFNFLGK